MPANFPSNPTLNQQYSYLGSTWSWSGSYWQLTTSQLVTGINFTYANTAPVAPNPGDRWVDTTTMLELVYVYDGNSYQWIELSSQAPSVNFGSIAANIVPAANITYDLGTTTSRWRDLYLSGNTLYLGAATVSATGSAINLPAGSTVAGATVATSTEVSTGGGPKITNVQVTNNAWTVLDDTAVDIVGGYVKITGTNFVSGCQVIAGTTTASAVSFISSTELRVQFGAVAAGTYVLYVSNPDGGVALRVNGITFSATPAWQTASSLGEIYDAVVINLGLVATGASTYAVTSGSLPPGLSLSANTGVITGTVTGVTVDTTYNFTVTATDTELQDSPRSFSITVTVSDPYFKLTTLLLSGSALSANTVVRDSSTNNFNITVSGDSRSSVFTPYGTGWSVYFDGTGDYLDCGSNAAYQFGTGDFTIECWQFTSGYNGSGAKIFQYATDGNYSGGGYGADMNSLTNLTFYTAGAASTLSATLTAYQWNHVAIVRSSSTTKIYINGNSAASSSDNTNYSYTGTYPFAVGSGRNGSGNFNNGYTGYISNFRLVKGTALYTANFTPATTNLTAVANTSLLTCHANRFLDGSTNNFAITPNGDIKVVNINPFNITNTGVAGSMYFDGNGDYLTVASNAALDLSGDFTVEGWFYFNSLSGDPGIFNIGSDASGLVIRIVSSKIYAYFTGGGNVFGSSVPTLVTGTWYHFAWSRSGSSQKFFINGGQSGTTYSSSSTASSTGGVGIGRSVAGTSFGDFNGYISDVRIIKGTAVYTANFTPTTSSLTAIANTQLLTLQYRQPHNNHTFLDNSNNRYVVGRTGNPTQGAFTPFSQAGWSYYFDGTGDFLSITGNAATNFSGVDWTIESWFYQTALSGGINAICQSQTGTNNWIPYFSLGLDNSRQINVSINAASYTSSQTYSLNTWNHLAMVRSAGVVKVYLNGTATSISVTSDIINSNLSFWIGKTDNAPGGGGYLYYFNGYLSNLRIVKGTAVYTANFTPPTAQLTAITNTSLLTCHTNRFWDASTNNFTVTISGDARVMSFSPFGPTAVYNPAVHGGSAYFDGSSDWLYLGLAGSTCHPNLKVPSGSPFSIEFWVYPQNSNVIINLGSHRAAYASEMALYIYYTAAIVSIRTGGTTGTAYTINFSSGNSLVSNEWQHVALVRESNNDVYLYRNGIRGAAVNVPGALDPYSSRLDITSEMGFYVGISQSIWTSYNPVYFQGYLSNLRYVVGTAVYTGNFTPPSAPVTAIANTQLLIDFTDAAILDSTGRNVLETVADAKTSSVITKFTGASMYFDGTGDVAIVPNSALFTLGTNNFTIESWVYVTQQTTNQYYHIFGKRPSTGNQSYIALSIRNNLAIFLFAGSNSGAWSSITTGNINIPLNTWTHIALARNGSAFNVYINGTRDSGASTTSAASVIDNSTPFYIGTGTTDTGGEFFAGYLADFRFTNGYARYTANFTAPTAPARLK